MSELPSIYSSQGLSASERQKVITTGRPRDQRPVGAIKIESRVNNAIDQNQDLDNDGDIPMLGMDDESEVRFVTDYLLDKREKETIIETVLPIELISKLERDLTPEAKPSKQTVMVVDTNFMISHLNILEGLAKLHTKYHHKIIIPTTTVRELDGLKLSKKQSDDSVDGTTIGHLARWANDWIYKKFAESDSAVRGQKLKEVLDRDASKDDSILDCCLYFHQKESALVILLSNDKNLCTKALTNDILTVSYRKGMSAELIAKMSFVENRNGGSNEPITDQAKHEESGNLLYTGLSDLQDHEMITEQNDYYDDKSIEMEDELNDAVPINHEERENPSNNLLIAIDDFSDAVDLIYREVQTLVLDAIDYCMCQEYGDDLELVGYEKSEIITLPDSANTLIRFWMSVFTEYFKKGNFRPFIGRGKKTPQYIKVPRSETELNGFVIYWSSVLRGLYAKRDETQNSALEKIIERWEHLRNSHQ